MKWDPDKAVRDHALQVVVDPKSTPDDVAVAKKRLLFVRPHPIESVDVAKLDREEREKFRRAMRIILGEGDPELLVDRYTPTAPAIPAAVVEPEE